MTEDVICVSAINKEHIGLKIRRRSWVPDVYGVVTAVGERKILLKMFRRGKQSSEDDAKRFDLWEVLD